MDPIQHEWLPEAGLRELSWSIDTDTLQSLAEVWLNLSSSRLESLTLVSSTSGALLGEWKQVLRGHEAAALI